MRSLVEELCSSRCAGRAPGNGGWSRGARCGHGGAARCGCGSARAGGAGLPRGQRAGHHPGRRGSLGHGRRALRSSGHVARADLSRRRRQRGCRGHPGGGGGATGRAWAARARGVLHRGVRRGGAAPLLDRVDGLGALRPPPGGAARADRHVRVHGPRRARARRARNAGGGAAEPVSARRRAQRGDQRDGRRDRRRRARPDRPARGRRDHPDAVGLRRVLAPAGAVRIPDRRALECLSHAGGHAGSTRPGQDGRHRALARALRARQLRPRRIDSSARPATTSPRFTRCPRCATRSRRSTLTRKEAAGSLDRSWPRAIAKAACPTRASARWPR